MKYCSECGCENIDEAHFCRNCGHVFKTSAASNGIEQNDFVNEVKLDNGPGKVIVDENKDSLVSKIFYKKDKYTGELRIAKTKTISIAVFVLMFLFALFTPSEYSFIVILLTAITFGLMFAVPTYVIGYALGWAIDRLTH